MKRLTKKQAQVAWFIALWCGGLMSVLTMSYVIRWMMNVS